jgi:alanine dehydrogenase
MLHYFVVGFRACCIAAVLLLVTLDAGEPPHPLLGATRDQLLNRFGEPRSQLATGSREVWFYPRGRGILLGGVPGVLPGRVVVIGGGVAGTHAADMAVGLGAEVTILDRSVPRLRHINDVYGGRVRTLYSTRQASDHLMPETDLVIGAVLVAGAAAPKLVTAVHVKAMRPGSVLVDNSIDQGGCFETSRPTTHAEPTYIVDDIVHYCVTNMPGAVPRTSTFALTNVTLPFVKALANLGWREALRRDRHLANGLNICQGHVTFEAVARDLGLSYRPAEEALRAA